MSGLLAAASQQQAGKIALYNVPDFMLIHEKAMIDKGRDWYLPSYNDYREEFKMKRLTSFRQFGSLLLLQGQ